MSQVLTFSRVYPSYHPRAGQQTFFVEKILGGLIGMRRDISPWKKKVPLEFLQSLSKYIPASEPQTKFHTIRTGKRFMEGSKFSPRVWSGLPYKSKQITFFEDIEVTSVFDIEVRGKEIFINGKFYAESNYYNLRWRKIAEHDGLNSRELSDWLKIGQEQFSGQIICWNPGIDYTSNYNKEPKIFT